VISLVVLAVALFAVWGRKLSGAWRTVYVGSAILALYLNVFVGVVQSFEKFAYLRALRADRLGAGLSSSPRRWC